MKPNVARIHKWLWRNAKHPNRLLEGYFRSAATLNYLRTLCNGGAASLHSLRSWNLDQVLSPHLKKAYNQVVKNIVDGVDFVDVVAGSAYAPVKKRLFKKKKDLLNQYLDKKISRPVGFYSWFFVGGK